MLYTSVHCIFLYCLYYSQSPEYCLKYWLWAAKKSELQNVQKYMGTLPKNVDLREKHVLLLPLKVWFTSENSDFIILHQQTCRFDQQKESLPIIDWGLTNKNADWNVKLTFNHQKWGVDHLITENVYKWEWGSHHWGVPIKFHGQQLPDLFIPLRRVANGSPSIFKPTHFQNRTSIEQNCMGTWLQALWGQLHTLGSWQEKHPAAKALFMATASYTRRSQHIHIHSSSSTHSNGSHTQPGIVALLPLST